MSHFYSKFSVFDFRVAPSFRSIKAILIWKRVLQCSPQSGACYITISKAARAIGMRIDTMLWCGANAADFFNYCANNRSNREYCDCEGFAMKTCYFNLFTL